MIVIGIVPGLKSLAYVVLSVNERGLGDPVLWDVIHTRKTPDAAPLAQLAARAEVLALELSVVLERGPVLAVGLGPPYARAEPKPHVDAVRAMLERLTRSARIPLLSLENKGDLHDTLSEAAEERVTTRNLSEVLLGFVRRRVDGANRRFNLATATAVCAAYVAQKAQSRL